MEGSFAASVRNVEVEELRAQGYRLLGVEGGCRHCACLLVVGELTMGTTVKLMYRVE